MTSSPQESDITGDRSEVADILLEIWREVLGVENIDGGMNFFELGGESIAAMRIVAMANRRSIVIEIRDIFEHQTVDALATTAEVRDGH